MRKIILGLLSSSFLLTGCEKEKIEEKTIQGKWTIDKVTFWGITSDGDGSYLKFNSCDNDVCIGEDYKSSDQTTGTFDYELSSDETRLIINDESPDGGSWSGDWTIEKFTENELTISLSTFLGTATYEMSK